MRSSGTAFMPNRLTGVLLLLLCACSHAAAQDAAASAQDGKRAAYAVLVDNTGSMRSQFEEVKRLARRLVQEIHPHGPVALFRFTAAASLKEPIAPAAVGEPWGQDAARLTAYVDGLAVEPGQTPLVDAIDSVSEQLAARGDAEGGAAHGRVFILISDGEDRVSRLKAGDLIKRLKQRGVRVFAIGLVGELSNEGGLINKSKREAATDFLRKLTKETGGRLLLLPKAKQPEVDEFLQALAAAR